MRRGLYNKHICSSNKGRLDIDRGDQRSTRDGDDEEADGDEGQDEAERQLGVARALVQHAAQHQHHARDHAACKPQGRSLESSLNIKIGLFRD